LAASSALPSNQRQGNGVRILSSCESAVRDYLIAG
jgi:hypothetical protein